MAQHYKGEDYDPFPFDYEQNKRDMKEKLAKEAAFTCVESGGRVYQEGMSKRFYAACAAMQGMLANSVLIPRLDIEYKIKLSYKYADELLKQEHE